MSTIRLVDKVAIVTGGASGIGAAMVARLRAEGAAVIVADVQEERGLQVAAEYGADFRRLDVADQSQWAALMAHVESRHGRLDILCNNAGVVGGENTVESISMDTWNRLIAVNQTGVMLGCQHGVRQMRRNPGGSRGSIINTASTASYVALGYDLAYSTTKAAVRNLTKAVAVWCALNRTNIRCNSLHPGPIETPIFHDAVPAGTDLAPIFDSVSAMSPMRRMGRPEEVAAAVAFLASDEAPYINGAELVIDGGMMAMHPDIPRP